ncbi:MAG: ABC transporter permease, partial [Candidatus Limnocylindrus sp.]
MVESAIVRAALRAFTGVVMLFIYLPLVILAVYAFNASPLGGWPPSGFTLDWFGEAAGSPAIRDALTNSLIVATTSTVLALILGTLAAIAMAR